MDELLAIKDRAWDRFRILPGVHAVGIGKRIMRGVRTDETVLTVFVTAKQPLDQLARQAVVPTQFEGVRTDVIERPIPQALDGPISVQAVTVANGRNFTFTTSVDPVPKGTRIVVTARWHQGGGDKTLLFPVSGDGSITLADMLNRLVVGLQLSGFFDADLTGSTIAMRAKNADESFDATCYVLVSDRNAYANDYLRGGILIQGGSRTAGGTLGCIATLPPSPQHPEGRVVGVTCSHVVRDYVTEASPLRADASGSTTIELGVPEGTNLAPQTAITATFFRDIVQATVVYPIGDGQTLVQVAQGFVDEINGAGLTGVSATSTSLPPDKVRIDVAGFTGPGAYIDCRVHGPTQFSGSQPLHVKLATTAIGERVVTFSGSVSNANLGIFVDMDRTGFSATFGVYHNPPAHQSLEEVAQAISTAINQWPVAQRGLVSATAVGPKVTIASARDVRVWIEPDIRIGQPIDFYQAHAAPCCNFGIGRVLEARLDIDVALIQLDAGLKYKHHIQELNAIAGTQAPFLGQAVQKRGTSTGLTEGMVSAIATSGLVGATGLTRVYRNGVVIDSTILDTGGATTRAFSLPGDSGAAVVTAGDGMPRLVGLLFGGGHGSTSVMTPVDDIVDGFSHLGLSFDPGVGVDLNAVHTVPASTTSFQALPQRSLAGLGERMNEVGKQMAATSTGLEYVELVRHHLPDALALVNRNRRVATVWHRSGGPELLNAALRVLRFDDEPLPREIGGRPLVECISRLRKVFARHADPQLARDFARMSGWLTGCVGMTYTQMLGALRTEARE